MKESTMEQQETKEMSVTEAILRSFPITTSKGQTFMAGFPKNAHQRRCQAAMMHKAMKKTKKILEET
jgi:hypothetical protein